MPRVDRGNGKRRIGRAVPVVPVLRRHRHRRRAAIVGIAAAVTLVLTAVIGPNLPGATARAASVTYTGYSGSFVGDKWLWLGTIPANADAYYTVSGSLGQPTADEPAEIAWVCGSTRYWVDYVGTRVFALSSGNTVGATLNKTTSVRYCGVEWHGKGLPWNIDSTRVLVVGPDPTAIPPLPTPGPTGSPSPTPTPTATPTPTPSPTYAYPTPTPTPTGTPVCFGSPQPSGPALPSACPSPTPTATPTPCVYTLSGIGSYSTWRTTCYPGPGYVLIGKINVTSTADNLRWAFGPYPTGYADPVWDFGTGAYILQADFGAEDLAVACRFAYKGGTVDWDGHTDIGEPATGDTIGLMWHWTDSWAGTAEWYWINAVGTAAGNCHGADGTGPGFSPSPSPSGSAAPSPSVGPCYQTIIGSTGQPVTISVPCPSSTPGPDGTPDGGVNGDDGSGPDGGACVPGPMSGLCKPGMGVYGEGGDCPFPNASLNPLDYFGWIGCMIAQIPRVIGNAIRWLINAFIDLIVPATLGARLAAFTSDIGGRAPFSWLGALKAQMDAGLASPSAGDSLPATVTMYGRSISVGPSIAAVTAFFVPYRSWLVVLVNLGFVYWAFSEILAFVGRRHETRQLDLGL